MNEALKTLLVNARTASRSLNRATREEIDRTLRHVANAAEANMEKYWQPMPTIWQKWTLPTQNTTVCA